MTEEETPRWFEHPFPGRRIMCTACSVEVSASFHSSCRHLVTGVPANTLYGFPALLSTCPCNGSVSDCDWTLYTPPSPSATLDTVPPAEPADSSDEDSFCCAECGGRFSEDEVNTTHERYDDYGTQEVCNSCLRHYRECGSCGDYMYMYRTRDVYVSGGSENVEVCRPCVAGDRGQMSIEECSHCGQYTDTYDRCCVEYDDGTVDGCECHQCENANRIVHDYSYKPQPVFMLGREEVPNTRRNRFGEAYDSTLYMGVELEVEAPSRDAAQQVQSTLGDFVYLKEDSSIGNGFEIVSHPATFRYWMEQFNWDGIRSLRSDRTIRTSEACGLHIHVSKNAFSGPNHEYRWIMFWHRNQQVLKVLAGRDSSYGSYDNDQRDKLVSVVKKGDHSYRRSAINTQNEYTHEVRVFASTVYVNRIKAAIQLVEGTAEYTRSLTSSKVMKDGGYSWTEFIVWLRSHGTRYEQLVKRIVDLDIDGTPDRVVMPSRERYNNRQDRYVTVPARIIQEGK